MLRAAFIVLLIALLPSHARAKAKIALLIGNEAYGSEIGRLANPHNDVALLESKLKEIGFDVAIVRDAGLGALTRAVNAYARRVQATGPNAIGFFYYSGHGASDGSTNYLIPVDVKTTETGALWDESLGLTEITRKLKAEAGNATHFVVFDACRNTLKLTQPGSRAIVQAKGFVPVAQENGMLIAYATAEGELASDVGTGAGPYARVLAEEIVKPGIEAVVMFRAVQRRVREAIRQEPYLGFNALGDIYLAGKGEQLTAAPSTTQSGWSAAEREWQQYGKYTKDIRLLEAFQEKHKADPVYAQLAEARIEELKQQIAITTPPPPPAARPPSIDFPKNCDRGTISIAVGLLYLTPNIALPVRRKSEWSCLTPGAGKTEHFKDCDTCPEMVVVPSGSFTMGSPQSEPLKNDGETQVRVSIAKPFAVGRFAVTFDQWDTCAADGGCSGYKPADEGWGRGKQPVINVNWDDAKAYTLWLSKKTGKAYRLLSEAEREYVTRAGTTTPFWWGASITPKQANYRGNYTYAGSGSTGEYRQRTMPVDSFEPNAWGLYQVHGNVHDWTEDCWNDNNTDNPGDGHARTLGNCSERVVRGGSWDESPQNLRSASRYGIATGIELLSLGFRVARTLNP